MSDAQFLKYYTDVSAAVNNTCGAPFFLQIQSVGQWSHTSVQFESIGTVLNTNYQSTHFARIYTTQYGIGRIQVNDVNVSALAYQRIAPTVYFYYYEMQTTPYSDIYRISTFDLNVTFFVSGYICVKTMN